MIRKKALKLTISIDEEFVANAIEEAAKERGLSKENMALEIIRDWYDGLFEEEDLADHDAALKEYHDKGGTEGRELFQRLRRAE